MNVFLYVRVSTEEQSRSGLSLETQEKALKEYCERNSHTIIDIYREDLTIKYIKIQNFFYKITCYMCTHML